MVLYKLYGLCDEKRQQMKQAGQQGYSKSKEEKRRQMESSLAEVYCKRNKNIRCKSSSLRSRFIPREIY